MTTVKAGVFDYRSKTSAPVLKLEIPPFQHLQRYLNEFSFRFNNRGLRPRQPIQPLRGLYPVEGGTIDIEHVAAA